AVRFRTRRHPRGSAAARTRRISLRARLDPGSRAKLSAMRYTVVLTAEFPSIATSLLSPHFDVIAHPTEHDRTEEDMATLLAEADAAIVLLSDPITRRVMESNPNLRI